MTLDETVKKFPVSTRVYVIKNNENKKVIENFYVYGYRYENNRTFLISDTFILYDPDKCYLDYLDAKKNLPPEPKTIKIAVDENGRLIDYAIFDSDSVIDVVVDYKTHISHCCVVHGCKYGDDDCPVTNKKLLQQYLCEECDLDGISKLDIGRVFKNKN